MPEARKRRIAALAAAAAFCAAVPAHAGAVVADSRPRITVETALVVWNPLTSVEHLFVAARFENIDGPFAWWLPVPGEPRATVVTEDLRTSFSSLIASYRARTPRWELPALPNGEPRKALAFGGEGDLELIVHPLGTAKSVEDRLRAAGRRRDAALRDYLSRYDEGAYHLVEVRADPGRSSWTTPWIHLRFEAHRPYYPYREPAYRPDLHAPRDDDRLLRLYVLSSERMAQRHGGSVPTMAYAWLAFEPTHEEVRRSLRGVASELDFDVSQRLWLVSFEDRHDTRPGDDDLTFAPIGPVPKDGLPGTVGDATNAGLVFEPTGAPDEPKDRREPDVEKRPDEAAEPAAAVAVRRAGRRPALPVVFGVMVALALGVSAWLARSDRSVPK